MSNKKNVPSQQFQSKSKGIVRSVKMTKKKPSYDLSLAREYKIVETKDLSVKALDGDLSSYSSTEIEQAPMSIRKEYRVVIPYDISKKGLESTLVKLVNDQTAKDKDIDAIVVFAYDDEADIDSMYTFGKLEWGPNGEWGSVTSNIAGSNNRSSYEYDINVKDKVGVPKVMKDSSEPTEREIEIFEAFDKALNAELDTPEPVMKSRVAKNLGISEKELHDIYTKVLLYKMK